MALWRLTYNLDDSKRITKALRSLRDSVKTRKGFAEFYFDLLTNDNAVPAFFRGLFESRGVGGSYYSRSWLPLGDSYLLWKQRKGYDTRIGFRTGNLYESLTVPGSPYNILKINNRRALFGTAVVDTEKGKEKGSHYAGKFNEKRPVIDSDEIANLRAFLLEGSGRRGFNSAAVSFKRMLIDKAVRQ